MVERFRDELGDWRIVIHSPFGAQVHAPWALAIGARLREKHGLDPQVMHADDGIVLRLPDADLLDFPVEQAVPDDAPVGADAALFDSGEIEQLVTDQVGGSALFASRFRECAGRALLLPRRSPGRRTPLWQQRQRSAQLLEVAAEYGSFPIVLEAVRECLQDVFDVPGLVELMRDLESRAVRLVEVTTPEPSPFARSLLFGYVAQFLYEGDSPLAERRAAALSLDSRLLSELLGQAELRELLDPQVLAELEAELQRLTPERRVKDAEGVADALRLLGPLTEAELTARGAEPLWALELEAARRVIAVRIAGEQCWAAVEDAGRLRDALGTPLPVGVPEAFTEPVKDPLGDLLARYARTHGPFTAVEAAARFGLGSAVVAGTLQRLTAAGRLVQGEFRPPDARHPAPRAPRSASPEGHLATVEWCDAEVLRRLRRRSLAALRQEVEAVPPRALAAFLPQWQHLAGHRLRGPDGLLRVVEQLQGTALPASALEKLILPARLADYSPGLLDELMAAGEIGWSGAGALPGKDGWISLHLAENAHLLRPEPVPPAVTPVHSALMESLAGGYGLFFRQLVAQLPDTPEAELVEALWDLVWAGYVSNDTLAPLRALLGSGRTAGATAHRAPRATPRGRYGGAGRAFGRAGGALRSGPPTVAGRWSLLPAFDADPTVRATTQAQSLLDRHGLLTRGAVAAERVPGGFAGVYRVLAAMEERGRARRGYFVEGLGGAQFAMDGAADRLRSVNGRLERARAAEWPAGPAAEPPQVLVLAAADPANAYGAALPWPDPPATPGAGEPEAGKGGKETKEARAHRPGRKAGALVVLVDGELSLYVERGGKSLLAWPEDEGTLAAATAALASVVRAGALGSVTVERANGVPALGSALGAALEEAGFHATPRACGCGPEAPGPAPRNRPDEHRPDGHQPDEHGEGREPGVPSRGLRTASLVSPDRRLRLQRGPRLTRSAPHRPGRPPVGMHRDQAEPPPAGREHPQHGSVRGLSPEHQPARECGRQRRQNPTQRPGHQLPQPYSGLGERRCCFPHDRPPSLAPGTRRPGVEARSGGDHVHRGGLGREVRPVGAGGGQRYRFEHRPQQFTFGEAGHRRKFGEREFVADLAHDLGHSNVECVADRGEQLRGGLLLSPLDLGEVTERNPGCCRHLAKCAALALALPTQYIAQ